VTQLEFGQERKNLLTYCPTGRGGGSETGPTVGIITVVLPLCVVTDWPANGCSAGNGALLLTHLPSKIQTGARTES